MRHFFSKTTVEASVWCQKCHKATMWKIAGGRPMHCMECFSKAPRKKEKPPASGELFAK